MSEKFYFINDTDRKIAEAEAKLKEKIDAMRKSAGGDAQVVQPNEQTPSLKPANEGEDHGGEGIQSGDSFRQADAQEGESREGQGSRSEPGRGEDAREAQQVEEDRRDEELKKFSHKIRTLEGIINSMSDARAMQSQIDELKRANALLLERVESDRAERETRETEQREAAAQWTEDDEVVYGDTVSALERRLKAKGADPEKLARTVRALEEELAKVRGAQASVATTQKHLEWERFVERVRAAVPSMEQVNVDPVFVEHMNAPFMGTTRQALMDSAAQRGDAQAVAQIYHDFLAGKGATSPQRQTLKKDTYVQPSPTSVSTAPTAKREKSWEDEAAELSMTARKSPYKRDLDAEEARLNALITRLREK